MKTFTYLGKSAAAFVLAAALVAGGAMPAPAQVAVTEVNPVALANWATTATQMTSQVQNAVQQTSYMLQQINTMTADHVGLSSLQSMTPQLITAVQADSDFMNNLPATDMTGINMMQKLAPGWNPSNTDYAGWLQTLRNNSNNAAAKVLNVSNDTVTQESGQLATVLNQTVNNGPPANQLQGIQQLVTFASMEVQQLDKLLKIQAAMAQAMSVGFMNKYAGSGSGGANTAGVAGIGATQHAAYSLCMAGYENYQDMSPTMQNTLRQQCLTNASRIQQQDQTTTPGSP